MFNAHQPTQSYLPAGDPSLIVRPDGSMARLPPLDPPLSCYVDVKRLDACSCRDVGCMCRD